MNSGETIIGLTNARIKFPDVTNLMCYLMNSDEDFDEAEFAFDWSEPVFPIWLKQVMR